MRFLFVLITAVLFGCISSQDYTGTDEATHLTNQCFRLKESAFVFEGRCAGLTGGNDNSELCNSIQIAGKGDFPENWDSYLKVRSAFDEKMFKRLAFEKQRTMLGYVEAGSKIDITRLVHHGWGTRGRYWVVRGNISFNGDLIEVELPSFRPVHHMPFWLDGRKKGVPELDSEYIESCK